VKKIIKKEMREHAPFTVLGALTGILVMFVFYRIPAGAAHRIFYTLHPLHVFLSALVTASMYRMHIKSVWWKVILVGYLGSVGIATISDSVIPFLAEGLLGLPDREIHLGFIEKWWLVNPLALLGISFAFFRPTTKVPHFGHVLLSTWTSLFHIIMALGGVLGVVRIFVIFVFLFLAVWLPCCLSDIFFPLLFTKGEHEKAKSTV
jgi:hypothetical protein